jgi:hypothetical protein
MIRFIFGGVVGFMTGTIYAAWKMVDSSGESKVFEFVSYLKGLWEVMGL